MRKHIGIVLLGLIILSVLVLYLVAFTVRWQEKALVLTFGKISRVEDSPGLKWVWPWQKVVKFDGRIRTFEQQAIETTTSDQQNIIVSIYVNWRIGNPAVFHQRFRTGAAAASEDIIAQAEDVAIGPWLAEAVNVFSQYELGQLVTVDKADFKLPQIERAADSGMLQLVQSKSESRDDVEGGYGIEIIDLGISRLGIPDDVTESVFDRMRQDRQAEVTTLGAEADSVATSIRGDAEAKAKQIEADAEAKAKQIEADGDAKAAEYYATFLDHPELASFLRSLETLRTTLTQRTTIVIDAESAPFDLIKNAPSVKDISRDAGI